MNEIKGVEIFATGEWNGDKYTEKDLDDMVSAFEAQGFVPPLKLGHDETPGRPAVGWIARLRRAGKKLLADFTNVPDEVYKLIKRRGYDRVSAEIYWNLKQGTQVFRRALKAVALLGADIPAVSTLAPLHTLFSQIEGEVRIYDMISNTTPEEAGDRIAQLAAEIARQENVPLWRANALAVQRNPELGELYAFGSPKMPIGTSHKPYSGEALSGMTAARAGEIIAEHAKEIARNEGIPLHAANVEAVRRNPEVAAIYVHGESE